MRSPSVPVGFAGLESAEALRQLAEALPHAVFTTDCEGRITSWNRAAERITGWSEREAIGRECSLLAGDAVNGCACGAGPIRCGMVERGRSSRSCTIRARDGRSVVIVKNAVPMFAQDGTPVGALEAFAEVGAGGGERRERGPGPGDFCGMIGGAASMRELFDTIELVARSDATVMVLGESGCGKERVAEAIHARSPRASGPFVRVSCSALNENLLESELFGHVRGAFTGAVRDRRGRFQEAHGGTLLLDEIGDISPIVQVKLLRVIEQREIERVGESLPVRIDVRIVCATHRDLKALVQAGRFRADLYFRLAVFPVRVPPLRDRLDDLPALAADALRRAAGRTDAPALAPDALDALRAHGWPGNVRELQNVLEFAALRAQGGAIRAAHLPAELHVGAGGPRPTAIAARAPICRETILDALSACGGNRTAAARELGISRVTLWKRLKELRLE